MLPLKTRLVLVLLSNACGAGAAHADTIGLRGALTPPAAAAPPAAPGHAVQIGVFNSARIAQERWTAIRRDFSQDVDGQRLRVIPIELNGRPAYRAQIAGFESRTAASGFCTTLSRSGHACFVPPLAR